MIEWTALNEKLNDIRRALLRDNIDPSDIPPFAVTRDEQFELKRHMGLTYDQYNDIDSGRFQFHGFTFLLVDSTVDGRESPAEVNEEARMLTIDEMNAMIEDGAWPKCGNCGDCDSCLWLQHG